MTATRPNVGTCALTGATGKFVRSHLIPRAFCHKNLDKVSRIEWGERGRKPNLRHTGWYDDHLVTDAGERKLAQYDSFAANQIRRQGLCWRFFPISESAHRRQLGEFELITIPGANSARLRLFFLSLLWRATTTKHPGFREIRVDPMSRRKLRKIVNGDIEADPADFPIVLVLMTTQGPPQNLTPLRQRIQIPQIAEGLPRDIKACRFFLDGLIAHIGRKSMDTKLLRAWAPRAVGRGDDLIVIGRPYGGSFQERNWAFLEAGKTTANLRLI
ncbi:MAG: hypothetical protein R6X03_00895, partial [Methyloceanibacter sp.]